jgi:hypothetical protein
MTWHLCVQISCELTILSTRAVLPIQTERRVNSLVR